MQYINTCNGSRGSHYDLILEVTQNSQSIENNTSNVTMSAYLQSNNSSYYFYGYSATTNLTFNGSTKATNTVTVDTRNGNKVLLATWTDNVGHNSDGTLKVNVGATFTCNYSYVTGGSVSGQFEFNTIPRASTFGYIPDFVLDGNEGVGVPFSVPVTKKSNALTDTLQIYMPTSSGYKLVATRNNYSSGTVTFSSSELNTIYPLFTTTQVNFRFNLTTKSGSTTIGTDEAYALGKLSTTGLNPTFSNINLTYKDINTKTTAITGNNQIIIKDFSNMQITLNSKATAHKGATMKNYILGSTSDLQTFSASASLPFTVTENLPNQSYYAKAIDSRGNQTQVTKNVQTFINYELPNSIKINLKRSNNGAGESVSVSISGKYYNWTGLAVNNEITNISVDYREKGSSTWSYAVNLTSTSSNGNFSVSETSLGNFDVSKEYEFRFGITDKLSSVTENATLNSGEPYIWHMKNSKIMGIGGKPDDSLPEGSLQTFGKIVNANNGLFVNSCLGRIEGGSDYNDFLEQGEYTVSVASGTSATNSPVSGAHWGKLIVKNTYGNDGSTGAVWQHFISSGGIEYKRRRSTPSESFNEWVCVSGGWKTDSSYSYLPNGMIVEWGIATVDANQSYKTVTLPTAVSNKIVNVQVTPYYNNYNALFVCASNLTKQSFRLHCRQKDGSTITTNNDFYWFVIGY